MNGHPHHPGTEELAEFRAGATEAARSDQIAAHTAECPECAAVCERLDEVPAILASIPAPAMPGDLEARILAALAAEAGRATAAASSPSVSSATASPEAASTSASPEPSSAPLSPTVLPAASLSSAASRRRARRRQNVTAPLGVLVAAAACLMLAFVGYRLSDTGHPASSSAAPANSPTQNSPAAGPHRDNRSPAMGPASTASFVVLVSSTNFRKATLQAQVTQQLPGGHVSPGAIHDPKAIPPPSLVGCVTSLLGHTKPALVEEATYQSLPVYMIAVANHAWVVARDCTAANPVVLASVALPATR